MQDQLKVCFERVFQFESCGFKPVMSENGDFWRLFLDYCKAGKNRELAVYSSDQCAPTIQKTENEYVITYHELIAEDGTKHDIALSLYAFIQNGGEVSFRFSIENNSGVRVNEIQYPFLEFESINGDFKNDILYLPDGLGRKVKNHIWTRSFRTPNIWRRMIKTL